MKSSSVGRRVSGNQHTRLAVFDYPLWANTTNTVWQKSISRTKNVFLKSFHIPGLSLPQGKSNNITYAISMHPNEGKCAFYVDKAIMVHIQGIQFGDVRDVEGETVENYMLQYLLGNDRYDDQ